MTSIKIDISFLSFFWYIFNVVNYFILLWIVCYFYCCELCVSKNCPSS